MPAIGHTIYIQLPGTSNRRVLHPCTVTQVTDKDSLTVLPDDLDLSFEVEQEFIINFEKDRQFMQQPAKVEALLDIDNGTVIALKTIGEPVSAENRQCYRVNTALSNLHATFGGIDNCSLRDVSVTGFAVTSPQKYAIGHVVDAELKFDGSRYSGQASIQSIHAQADGKTRYGANCVITTAGPETLAKGVQSISMAVQRQQLSRLAGGA